MYVNIHHPSISMMHEDPRGQNIYSLNRLCACYIQELTANLAHIIVYYYALNAMDCCISSPFYHIDVLQNQRPCLEHLSCMCANPYTAHVH